jgi:lipoprotein-releasing system ATP-binding protein
MEISFLYKNRQAKQGGRILKTRMKFPESAIVTHQIRKSFWEGDKELEVLKGITLNIKVGEIIALMGPSGAGKSTLLHILGLMETVTSGELQILGYNIKEIQETQKDIIRNKHIGFLFQFHYLLPELTLLENVALPLRIQRVVNAQALEQATQLLISVGLKERMSHYPSEISGGEQQRAALARAMVNQPVILICDEPTGNLDLERGEEIRDLIWRVARSQHSTVLIATHNPEIAKKADRMIKMVDGQMSER